jgi:HEAT repeat protein
MTFGEMTRLGVCAKVAVGLLTVCLGGCTSGMKWQPVRARDMVWYQKGISETKVRSDLQACKAAASDVGAINACMQAKGYYSIPREEEELLKVKALQEKGLGDKDIARRLDWKEKKVSQYTDDRYELEDGGQLAMQPVEILASLGKPAVEPLIDALAGADPLVRRQAAQALGEIKDPRAVQPLIGLLKDRDALIRRHAVEALGKIKDGRAVSPLAARLADKREESHVRTAAAEALGTLRDPAALESLIAGLTAPDWALRSRAAEALGKIGDVRALDPLMDALRDQDPVVRGYAVEALGELKDLRAVVPVGAALQDRDREVRKKAEEALAKIKDNR